ncbi:type IV secretion system protein [uncultured Treponema sp.]|uniref:type IV secretion system protein n=2 Tax=Treponema TaxID=157 RepID=UPI002601CEEA|nr:type IV secretion system protein [uncultured Treponema sp.]
MSTKQYPPAGKVQTPFYPQLEHFDWITGQIRRENHILRIVAVISCLAFFLSIGISLYAVAQPDSIPVIVTMNDFGQASYVGPVSRKNYQNFNVPEVAVQYQVKDFLNLYHTLSTDKTVMKKSVNKIYHILTSTTASKYSSLVKEEKPFEYFGTRTREVLFQTEPLKLSKDSYQIDYQVLTRQVSGSVVSNVAYRAVISVKTLQPSEDDIKDNPLGIYITAFDMKEINTKLYSGEPK